jgi:hypothetical protein
MLSLRPSTPSRTPARSKNSLIADAAMACRRGPGVDRGHDSFGSMLSKKGDSRSGASSFSVPTEKNWRGRCNHEVLQANDARRRVDGGPRVQSASVLRFCTAHTHGGPFFANEKLPGVGYSFSPLKETRKQLYQPLVTKRTSSRSEPMSLVNIELHRAVVTHLQ